RAWSTARVARRAARVVALVKRGAVGKETSRRHRSAVVLQHCEQRVLADLVARGVEAALVRGVEVVTVGAEWLAAVLVARVGVAAADDRVLDVCGLSTVGEVASLSRPGGAPRGPQRVVRDRRVEKRERVAGIDPTAVDDP